MTGFALACLIAFAPAPTPETELKAMLVAQQAAWNAGKLDGFLAAYSDGPELRFYSGGTITEGKEAVAARYRKNYQADGKEMGTLSFTGLEVEELGPTAAMVRGKWAVKLKGETPSGLFTLICKKTDGGWKITHDHTSK